MARAVRFLLEPDGYVTGQGLPGGWRSDALAMESGELLDAAWNARRDGRLDDARRDLSQALELFRDDPPNLARTLGRLGQIERDTGNINAAMARYEAAAAIYRSEGDSLALAHAVRHIGDIQRETGHPALAQLSYEEALNLYRSNPGTLPLDLANAIRGLAILRSDAGEVQAARSLWAEARDLYASVGVRAGVTESSRTVSGVGIVECRNHRALRHLRFGDRRLLYPLSGLRFAGRTFHGTLATVAMAARRCHADTNGSKHASRTSPACLDASTFR